MLDANTEEWFMRKLMADPEYIGKRFIESLKRESVYSHNILHDVIRKNDLLSIKYHQGLFDGVQKCLDIMNGLRLSEGGNPVVAGLGPRIRSFFGGNKNGAE